MSSDRTTEILNYVSAISREVGALRMEMKTRFEQLETEMGTVKAEVGTVKAEMRTGFAQLETRMSGIETEMRTGFEGVRGDVRHLGRKVDIMNQDLLKVRADQRDLEGHMDALERKQV